MIVHKEGNWLEESSNGREGDNICCHKSKSRNLSGFYRILDKLYRFMWQHANFSETPSNYVINFQHLNPLGDSMSDQALPLPTFVTKQYTGTEKQSAYQFEKDSAKMAAQGYRPLSQTWMQGSAVVAHSSVRCWLAVYLGFCWQQWLSYWALSLAWLLPLAFFLDRSHLESWWLIMSWSKVENNFHMIHG